MIYDAIKPFSVTLYFDAIRWGLELVIERNVILLLVTCFTFPFS